MRYEHTAGLAKPHKTVLTGEAILHVCVMVSNPRRYQSRYKLLESFLAQNSSTNVKLWIVEIAFGNRPFMVTERDDPQHLQLRTTSEIWHKEDALNQLFSQVLSVDPDAEYFAWVDADVTFSRADWACETIQQLQHYDVVQMFTHAQDVGPHYEPLPNRHVGFVYAYYNDDNFMSSHKRFGYSSSGHPGFAWAAKKSAIDTFGGLIDFAIVGGADRHMAQGLIGTIDTSGPSRNHRLGDLHPNFRNSLFAWQERALLLNKNIGYVDGLLLHHWHGKKADRKYGDRWKIYVKHQFDPIKHLQRDSQGLYKLVPHAIGLRDDLRSYLCSRNEDSIDM